MCDASEKVVGAALFHRMMDGFKEPIAFASRTLHAAEKRYASIDREALSLLIAIKKFRQYIVG